MHQMFRQIGETAQEFQVFDFLSQKEAHHQILIQSTPDKTSLKKTKVTTLIMGGHGEPNSKNPCNLCMNGWLFVLTKAPLFVCVLQLAICGTLSVLG